MRHPPRQWQRHPDNPVLAPGSTHAYDANGCTTPFAVRVDDEYWLYYSGRDAEGRQRICLAVAPLENPSVFERRGVVLDLGDPGSFDARGCTFPAINRFDGAWYLYYSGHEDSDLGLQSFPGIGLAVSEDGIHFERYPESPIITGNRTTEFKGNRGVTGGGSILPVKDLDGVTSYLLTYTVAAGRDDLKGEAGKEHHAAVCRSMDGIDWYDHRLVLSPRKSVPTEDIAVAAPFAWQDGPIYRMLYSRTGSQSLYYAIAEAVSIDGMNWIRGEGCPPALAAEANCPWEGGSVAFASVVREGTGFRLFYAGGPDGMTGIGTAVSQGRTG